MKLKSSLFRMVLLVLCASALIVACHLPGGPPSTTGSLKITIGNNIAARTIVPPTEGTTATLYKVNGAGPNGAKFTAETGGDPVTVSGLALGQWTVSVDGFNAKGDTIGHGESSATVAAGENSVTVSVLLASGSGTLSLTVTWNTSQVQGPGSVSASITSVNGGSPQPLSSFGGSDGSLSSNTTDIPPGYYILNLSLLDHTGNTVGSTTDLVWVVNAQTSTGSFDFTNALNAGSLKVSIIPLPNPLDVSISQSGSTFSAVVNSYSGTDLNYLWYVNGAQVGTNSNSYNLTSMPGRYWVSVIVHTTDETRWGSATANFQIGENAYYISFKYDGTAITFTQGMVGAAVETGWGHDRVTYDRTHIVASSAGLSLGSQPDLDITLVGAPGSQPPTGSFTFSDGVHEIHDISYSGCGLFSKSGPRPGAAATVVVTKAEGVGGIIEGTFFAKVVDENTLSTHSMSEGKFRVKRFADVSSAPEFVGTWTGTDPMGTSMTLTLTSTTLHVFIKDPGSGATATLDGNLSGIDETLKHFIVTYNAITNNGLWPNPPYKVGDFEYILYAVSGNTMTAEGSPANVATFPPAFDSSASTFTKVP